MSKVWLFEEIFKYFSSQMSCFHFASPNRERFQTAALLDDSRRLQMCVTGSVIAFDSVKRHRRTVWVTKPPPHQNPHRLARTSEERSGGVDLWSRRAAGTQTAVSFSHGGLWRQQSDGEESVHVSVLKGTSHQSDSESFWDVLEVVRDQRGFSRATVMWGFWFSSDLTVKSVEGTLCSSCGSGTKQTRGHQNRSRTMLLILQTACLSGAVF